MQVAGKNFLDKFKYRLREKKFLRKNVISYFCQDNFEICIKCYAIEFPLQRRKQHEISWYEIRNVKRMSSF